MALVFCQTPSLRRCFVCRWWSTCIQTEWPFDTQSLWIRKRTSDQLCGTPTTIHFCPRYTTGPGFLTALQQTRKHQTEKQNKNPKSEGSFHSYVLGTPFFLVCIHITPFGKIAISVYELILQITYMSRKHFTPESK